MHNNRAYHQERMYMQLMARQASTAASTTSDIGTALTTRTSITRSIAKGYGMYWRRPHQPIRRIWVRPYARRSSG